MSGTWPTTVASEFLVVRLPHGALIYGVPSAFGSHLGKQPVSRVPQLELPTCVFTGNDDEVVGETDEVIRAVKV